MAHPSRFVVAILLLVGGCHPVMMMRSSGVATFEGTGGDLTAEVTLHGAGFYFHDNGRPELLADLGRCLVVETDDGRSRLEYPADRPSGRPGGPATRPTVSVAMGPDPNVGGSIALTRTGDGVVALPRPTGDLWGDVILTMFILPGFVCQPFAALPDRLAATLDGPAPVAPALVELAHDLVDYKGTAAVGSLRDCGVFTIRLTLTDAGRAKLRAALARHDATTRPTTRPTAGLPPAIR